MNQFVVVLTGLPGSGKTTASDYFRKQHLSVVSMGEITRMLLQEKKLLQTEENEKAIRTNLRKNHGEDIYARLIMKDVRKMLRKHQLVAIEGLRSEKELDYFKKKLTDVKLIFINADRRIRYLRLQKRQFRPLDYHQAKQRDIWEKSQGVLRLRRSADWNIENQSTKSEFYAKLNQVIKAAPI
ncbi:hypothetical protein FJY90_06790 [Candidatus Gottesmanbacteria bacterium]|nr:hypothetical protein [Candidatus Gottesmanbacteria bacterium]